MRPESCQTFSTLDVPPPVRVGRWNDFGSETLASMVVDPADRAGFGAQISRLMIGGLGFTWMDTTPARARGCGAGAWASPGRDAFLLNVQSRGRSRVMQAGHDVVLETGDMVLLDANRPFLSEADAPMSEVVLKLPVERLIARLPDPEALAGIRLRGDRGAAAFASGILLSTRRLLGEEGGGWEETIADIVLDALGMAFARADGAAPRPDRGSLRRREACAYIERHLTDPELTVAGIAQGLGVSIRYLQRMFLEIGTTPRAYVLDRRLDEAARRLRRAGDRIIDVALGVGFNDLSYFNRAFHKKLGLTPSDYRRSKGAASEH